MSDARRSMFERVRAALANVADKAPLPDYPPDVARSLGAQAPGDPVARFSERLAAVRGRAFTEPAALGAWLREQGATRGYCDPALAGVLAPALGAGIALETALDRARIDDYAFGVTRARGAIAETGSLILDDAGTARRLGALAPWIHVAVLDPARILPDVAAALAALGADPNVIFCTGPSKTADVEGILIEGVHGPGEQVALIHAFRAP
ncbi:MAG TPA: LUD domain-containing protein [Polyangia bacterium]|nr:LUD domain-containing protein [Polyangia bacterium]